MKTKYLLPLVFLLFFGCNSTPTNSAFEPIQRVKSYFDFIWGNKEEDKEIYSTVGMNKFKSEDFKGAIESFNKYLEISPNDTVILLYRGLSKGNLDNDTGAINDFTRLLMINDKCADAYIVRASVYYACGEKEKSCLDLYKAKELGNKDAQKYINEHCLDSLTR